MEQLLNVDGQSFAASFGGSPMGLTHALTTHALLTPEAVAELADSLPEAKVEHNQGDIPALLAAGGAPLVRRLAPGARGRGGGDPAAR